MRTLVILRGPARSGRTGFVERSALDPWHVDQAALYRVLTDPVTGGGGGLVADRFQRRRARDRMRELLREKFRRGALVVFEPFDTGAPSGKTTASAGDRLIREVIGDARAWRYQVVIVDFTSAVGAEELAARFDHAPPIYGPGPGRAEILQSRAHMRRRAGLADLEGIAWIDARDLTAPAALLDRIEPARLDLSRYRNLVAIGDIHGCHETLVKLLGPEGPRDDTAYLFLGDFIDKGPRPAEVLIHLTRVFGDRENAVFLAGNHERALEDWVNSRPASKKSFTSTTLPDFEARGFTPQDGRRFLSMLRDGARIDWGGMEILATHGGFPRRVERMAALSAEHLQHGPETSAFDIDAAWEAGVVAGETPPPSRLIQVHGHRNTHARPVAAAAGSYNLEGGIDRGGAMRALILRRDGDGRVHTRTLETANSEISGAGRVAATPGRDESRDGGPADAPLPGGAR